MLRRFTGNKKLIRNNQRYYHSENNYPFWMLRVYKKKIGENEVKTYCLPPSGYFIMCLFCLLMSNKK
jgi:hypothetical protein